MGKLATLLLLYFSQGLPFGFQATALPLMLRERGLSLQSIGFASVLAAPWMAKPLWAPWVDRYGSQRFGRRKSWIVPMQLALAVCAVVAGRTERVELLLGLVFAMNLCAATQDIAVDALAISWIRPSELGVTNAVQTVGYKLGMLTGGGLLMWASGHLGYRGAFDAMAMLQVREPVSSAEREPGAAALQSLRSIALQLGQVLREPHALPLIAVIVSYKAGEALADGMWKPLLFDRGFSAPDIGLWNGTYGMVASFLGSMAAGLWVRSRSLSSTLAWIAVLRAAGIAGEWWISVAAATPPRVVSVICVEHALGGAITTVLFALMMRHTQREIGATHFSVLASLEVWGKMPSGLLSGVLAQRAGYPTLFATATALSVLFAFLAFAVRTPLSAAADRA
jgi:hypothetical protein